MDLLNSPASLPQVHVFSVNGTTLALDVNSGALHLLDELSSSLLSDRGIVESLQHLDESSTPPGLLALASSPAAINADETDAVETLAELMELVRRGQLFSPGVMPEVHRGRPTLKALCLHVAHDCNLRCAYCFAKKGAFGGDRGLMSREVGEKAIDLLIRRSGARRRLAVDFFGGEPLLNLAVVRHLAEYAESRGRETGKEFTFTLTTNALALKGEAAEFLAGRNWNVVLSLDGRPEVHDRLRPMPGGTGSYAKVLPHIQDFVKAREGKGYYLRGTFTRHNMDFLEDVKHLLDLDIKEISIEPVVARDVEWALSEEDVPGLEKEYERLASFYLQRRREGRPFTFFHFNLSLFDSPCLAKRLTGCGAGYEYLAVTPDGKLYPCHQFVGRPGFEMGDVFDGEIDDALAQRFGSSDVTHKETCQSCWARFHCSGGCHANAHLFHEDLLRPYEVGCALQRKRIECALAIQAELAREGGLAG